jgi:hypothetical protein
MDHQGGRAHVVFKQRVEIKTKTGRIRDKWERGYRAPRPEDNNTEVIRARLAEKIPEWEANDIVPSESFPKDGNDDRLFSTELLDEE